MVLASCIRVRPGVVAGKNTHGICLWRTFPIKKMHAV